MRVKVKWTKVLAEGYVLLVTEHRSECGAAFHLACVVGPKVG